MSFAKKFSRHVEHGVQTRGRGYFYQGQVGDLQFENKAIAATVQGSQAYRVTLRRMEKGLQVACTCPYFTGNLEPCKHVWATMLAADHRDQLQPLCGKIPARILIEGDAEFERDEEDEEDFEENFEEEEEEDDSFRRGHSKRNARNVVAITSASARQARPGDLPRSGPEKPPPPTWKQHLATLTEALHHESLRPSSEWPLEREILYVVDGSATRQNNQITIEVVFRERKKDGQWGKQKTASFARIEISDLPDPADRQIMALLTGAQRLDRWTSYWPRNAPPIESRFLLSEPTQAAFLRQICESGRCRLRSAAEESELPVLHWDDGPPWEFWLEVSPEDAGKRYVVSGSLRRGEERLALSAPVLVCAGGLVFFQDRVAPLDDGGAFYWIALLRERGSLQAPKQDREELLRQILQLPRVPRLELPKELQFEVVRLAPRPHLKLRPRERWTPDRLAAELSFEYDGTVIPSRQAGGGIYRPARRQWIVRDTPAEEAAAERLRQLGFRRSRQAYRDEPDLELAARGLPGVVAALSNEQWHIEAEGKVYRRAGAFHMEVASGIDWFELHGEVRFDDCAAQLPELLKALKRGEKFVRLDDGTFGVLPEEWLKRYGFLAALGTPENGHIRFLPSQVGLLDALLAAQPEVTCDAAFSRAREELRRFEGVQPMDPARGFQGCLRGYQREGLGWLHFTQRFGFGGCLADDMGLGKTVQVLALLESRRELRASLKPGHKDRPGPSLVVVPRSLVFNWKQEAERFTPALRVLEHSGTQRDRSGGHFEEYDVVLTTYGTLRSDAALFQNQEFDYLILDEAQVVKNARTQSAKAVRLLKGRHRLAMSGTPVENHIGELWSLFEFLNPGMLGAASVFQLAGDRALSLDEGTRPLLARALRPFILRRTKAQVAKDLPEKLEQTLYCDLEPAQRTAYNELRNHFRHSLLARVQSEGLGKSKLHVLEALLRLRQAACHIGLLDPSKSGEPSAKLDMLLPKLFEVLNEGHKALVFSQFTSLLSIVKERLDREKVTYEYLDGQTRDRAARVERFQKDASCQLFLISLKAGGLGLNLTAAEYVFLLDPWWNPAVEAQAVDRAHRIGQTRRVFAYRLIARDTVEEKVLELQKTKRELVDAILTADQGLIRNLSREDLELLLS